MAPRGGGKKAYGARRSSANDPFMDDMSDTSSAYTGGRGGEDFEEYEEKVVDVYADNLDLLYEKRGTTRVAAYKALISYMKQEPRDYEADKNCDTLIGLCRTSLRKGGAAEKEAAATVLALHFVCLSGPGESLFEEVEPDVDEQAEGGSGAARAAAIEALAMCCYVAAEDDITTRQTMERMARFWKQGDAGSRASALRGWSLLFTSLSGVLTVEQVEGMLQQMATLINDKSVDVRSAAGELVALLCTHYRFLQEEDGEADDGSWGEEDGMEAGSVTSADVPETMDDLVHRMKDLASHNRHDALRTSKRDKAALKTTFRGILETVESGAVKAEKIKMKHGDMVVVDTLEGKVALGAFKRLLAGGLQTHLQINPLLHTVFDFQPSGEAPERLSAVEKRHLRSPCSGSSKDRATSRKQDRSYKTSRYAPPTEDVY